MPPAVELVCRVGFYLPESRLSLLDVEKDLARSVVDKAVDERVSPDDIFQLVEDQCVILGVEHRYGVENPPRFGTYEEEPPVPVRLRRYLRPVSSLSWGACPLGPRGSFAAFRHDFRMSISDDRRDRKKMPWWEYSAEEVVGVSHVVPLCAFGPYDYFINVYPIRGVIANSAQ